MEEIARLVKIVTKRGKKNIQLLDLKSDNDLNSKEMQLFNKIKEGKVGSDKDAAYEIYGEEKVDYRYRMLKSRLKQKLLNHLFFLDFNDSQIKASHHDEQECLNFLHQGRMLLKFGDLGIAEKILNKAINLAKGSEFNYIILDSLKLLRFIYASRVRPVMYDKNKEKLEHYKKLIKLEEEAAELYFKVKVELNRSVSSRKENLQFAEDGIETLRKLWEKTDSYNIFEHYHLLNVWFHELTGNYAKVIEITNHIDEQYKKTIINRKRFDDRFNKFAKIYAYLRIKDYKNGLAQAKEYVKSFSRYSTNWFSFMENYFLLAMHSRDYTLSGELLQEVERNPNYNKISELAKERWNLYTAYLQFINPTNRVNRSFNYYDFVSTVPEYSKDKEGFNLAILVLQYLYYLENKDLDALMFRVESLKKYMSRHFKETFSTRTVIFFKLLINLVQYDFDLKTCRKKSKYLYDKLKSADVPGDAYAEIEIIPYEHLWEWLMNKLEEFEEKGDRMSLA
ncbi:hypothetical protein AB9P05_05525 [Roseivirga sp. BDSF3-8]|uniref:hypothetical protein n=1 Tax=Roseivirga sp. BDSF3-8 TaxID=3241598 RepID=UPI003531CBD5